MHREDFPADGRLLLARLASRYTGERVEAQEELRRLGPEATELLLQFLAEEAGKRQKKRRLFWTLLGSGLGLAGALAVLLIALGHPEFLGILGSFGGLGGLAALLVPSQQQMAAVQALSQQDDLRAVGPLAEALAFPDLNVRTAAAATLMRLLPRLGPEDADLLNSTQRGVLHRILQTGERNKETELMSGVLGALARIEDASALPAVEKLAEMEAATENERRLKQEAEQALPGLTECRQRQMTHQTLLRAADPLRTTPDELLRPAANAGETPAEQLLRASQNEQD